jgi:hypothetical protein
MSRAPNGSPSLPRLPGAGTSERTARARSTHRRAALLAALAACARSSPTTSRRAAAWQLARRARCCAAAPLASCALWLTACLEAPGDAALTAERAGALAAPCRATVAAQHTVALPAFASRVRAAGFVPDAASGIAFAYDDRRDGAARIGYVRPDGSGFSCISCAGGFPGGVAYLPGEAFPDGRRMMLASGENNSTAQLDYAVLECAPSLARCDAATVLPIEGFPGGPKLQDRVPKLAPDGSHLVWTRIRPDGYFMIAAPLRRAARAYQLGDARVLNPPVAAQPGPGAGRRLSSAWYEAKSISHDGTELAFAGTLGDSLNLDWFTLSLDTGRVTRLTRDADWDEGGQSSPGGRFMTGGSSRGLGITAALGAVPRPPFFDHAIIGAVTNAFIPRELPPLPDRPRSSRLVQHVLDRSCPDSDAALLAVGAEDEGWIGNGGGGAIWARDGRRFVNAEKRADAPQETRLRVVTLDAPPRSDAPPAPLRLPAEAPRLAELAAEPGLAVPRSYPGPRGGTVTVLALGDLLGGVFVACYDGYATDDGVVLDGFQRATSLGPLLAHLEEQLVVSGARTGGSSIDVWFADAATRGTARSELDGAVFERSFDAPGLPGLPR